MFATSMRSPLNAYDLPPRWVPWPLRTENYRAALDNPVPLLGSMWRSSLIAVAVALGQVITCPMAGYAFARLKFPGRNLILLTLMSSMMVPVQVTVVPLYLLMNELGLLNRPLSLILPGFTAAFGVFLMRQFFITIPEEILEAGRVDGAGPWRTYRLIALPLAKGPMAALGIIAFLTSWNAYFLPSILLRDIDSGTMPQALVLLLGPYRTGNVAMIMAATTIAILPALAVFLVAQKWIVESLTHTGVKG